MLWDALGRLDALGRSGTALGRSGTLWDALGRSGKPWDALGRSGSLLDALGRPETPWEKPPESPKENPRTTLLGWEILLKPEPYKLPKVPKGCQNLPEAARSSQKLLELCRRYQKLPELPAGVGGILPKPEPCSSNHQGFT